MKIHYPDKIVSKALTGTLALFLMGSLGADTLKIHAASPGQFADPAFQKVWTRTDEPVQNLSVKRSWYWGPQPNSGAMMEDYAEGIGGKHLVQYFDKSRMEINNPNGDKNNPFYVTNGLLSRELISGYMQTGNNKVELRWPANIPVAGDTNAPVGTAVTYASFRGAIERTDEKAIDKVVISLIGWNGYLDFEHGGEPYMAYNRFNVKNAYYERATKHNIPDVFWSFLNTSGPIIVNGKKVSGRLSNPYFYVTGYPISDAYWTNAVIGGKPAVEVLVQAYERRMLTYVPSAPSGFKVQMGNVGQHYYDWRYKGTGKSPAMAGKCTQGDPVLGFGKVYNDNTLVKIQLGCQQAPETRETISIQSFERGHMISVSGYNFYSGTNFEDVYVLFSDGKAATFPFLAVPREPTPPPVPPIGNYATTRNFGLVYQSSMEVRTGLGNATANANVVAVGPGDPGTQRTGGGAVQYFEGGLMVYPNFPAKKIYTLYNNSGYAYESRGPHLTLTNINRWAAYDDTFQP